MLNPIGRHQQMSCTQRDVIEALYPPLDSIGVHPGEYERQKPIYHKFGKRHPLEEIRSLGEELFLCTHGLLQLLKPTCWQLPVQDLVALRKHI